MKLDEWRKSKIKPITLPSGLEVKVKEVNMLDAVMNGEIPNLLLEVVLNAKAGEELSMLKIADKYGGVINHITSLCLIEPAVAAKADANHIAVTELSFDDRLEIFNRTSGEVLRLMPFRKQPEQADATAPGGKGVRAKTVKAGGDKKPGGGVDAG
jgi:hypothetical protein